MADDKCILDTGPLVSLLHRDDQDHEACVDFLSRFRGNLLTTESVLTESMYLLGRYAGAAFACLDFFIRGGAVLVPLTHESLIRCNFLMNKYADVPMDFADATLVALAEEIKVKTVFTLDHRGFEVYRSMKNSAFHIVP
jgi:predicted nucleic acid-binding protein